MTNTVSLDLLLCGNGINFQQGDLALSTMVLVEAPVSGRTVRTVIDTGHVGMRRNILEALAKRNLGPEDIDFVALTHVHWDHVQNVDLFPNARIALSRAEFESIQAEGARDLVTPAWTRFLLTGERVLVLEPGSMELPGITVVDAAGHTPGSVAYSIELQSGLALVTGDALPWAEVGRLQLSALVFWNVQESQDSIRRLTDMADVIYPGHDRPFRLRDGKVEYLTDYDMTMFGADPFTEGLHFGTPPILSTIDLTDGEPVGPRWTKDELNRSAR